MEELNEDQGSYLPSSYFLDINVDVNGAHAVVEAFEVMRAIQDVYADGVDAVLHLSITCTSEQYAEDLRHLLEPMVHLTIYVAGTVTGAAVGMLLDFVEHGGPVVHIAPTARFVVNFPAYVADTTEIGRADVKAELARASRRRRKFIQRLHYLGLPVEFVDVLRTHHTVAFTAPIMQRMLNSAGKEVASE